jgi:hypothetical protein
MGKQSNAREKRKRRNRYLKRKKTQLRKQIAEKKRS